MLAAGRVWIDLVTINNFSGGHTMKTLTYILISSLPEAIVDVIIGHETMDSFNEIASKPFVCPNCGQEFYAKWRRLWFKGAGLLTNTTNKAQLKCPHCKETDACRWTGMERI